LFEVFEPQEISSAAAASVASAQRMRCARLKASAQQMRCARLSTMPP
jgi:hypothetical protein